MARTKKTTKRSDEPAAADNEELIEVGSEDEQLEEPTVTDWAAESANAANGQDRGPPFRPSLDILKITPEEGQALGEQTLKDTTINDTLRYLIRRGYDNANPALAKGCERLLKTLNCIPLRPVNERRGGRRPRNAGRRDSRGNGNGNGRRYNNRRHNNRRNRRSEEGSHANNSEEAPVEAADAQV